MTTHDNAKDKMTQKLIKAAALGIYHAPGGKRLLNWFFDWCERPAKDKPEAEKPDCNFWRPGSGLCNGTCRKVGKCLGVSDWGGDG